MQRSKEADGLNEKRHAEQKHLGCMPHHVERRYGVQLEEISCHSNALISIIIFINKQTSCSESWSSADMV